MQRNLKWKILLVLGVIGISLAHALPLNEKIHLGLDLSGGMHLVLKVDTETLEPDQRKDATERALEIIRNRIDEFGVSEPSIQRQGKERIIVQLPGITDRQRALDLIGRTALLEFKLVSNDKPEIGDDGEAVVPVGYSLQPFENDSLLVQKAIALKGETLVDAYVGSDQFGSPAVDFELSPVGARIFARVTEQNTGRRLAILLDGKIYSAPTIQGSIPGGRGQITGRFSYDEARDLAIILRAGALPAPVKVEEERTVGPTLGQDSVDKGVRASVLGVALVFIAMIVFFGWAGLIANFALALNLLIVLAALAYFNAALTLPGIAGLILIIGMSVDANVIIYERIREEIRKGSAIRSAIKSGYASAFRTILDANLTTLVTALILYNVGSGPIKGFAVTLSVGILASMFTAIFVTRLIFEMIAGKGPFKKFPMRRIVSATQFDFVGHRRIAYIASGILILVGIGAFSFKGTNNFGIDFTGGQLQQVHFKDPVQIQDIRSVLVSAGLGNLPVQHFGGDQDIIVRSPVGTEAKILEQLQEQYAEGDFEVVRVETVGPAVGQELRWKALKALGLSLLAVCLYITVRFRFDFSLAAILALVHDCFITIGLFALTGREFNLPMIAALLTIVGYSLNDTIVIFDRIRENLRRAGRKAYAQVINESLNQTLARTLLTSLTTLVVVTVLFISGGKVINNFAFALLIGAAAGTYSSVYVASSVLVTWQKRKKTA